MRVSKDRNLRGFGGRIVEVNAGNMRIMSVKLEIRALRKIDETWRKFGYRSRSDFIRDALRYFLNKLKSEKTTVPSTEGAA
ncbi:MAG TPA: ribbon-helix-helix protein, CopG family [Acidilobales archaeon]|nr:MAG: hypothetical protein B6U85_04170 [Desulfurococcales archaeon ex4484_42]HDD25865.1 ribbon-helix-helix protein, CopG family [Acidilobales archaeon]